MNTDTLESITVNGYVNRGSGYGGYFFGPDSHLENVEFDGMTGTALYFGGTRASLRGGSMRNLGLGSVGINLLAGVLSLEDFTFTQAAAATGISVSAGTTLRIGRNVNLSGMTTPLSVAGGGYVSRGVVTLNGTSAVSIAFPDLTAQDTVTLTQLTLGAGGTGVCPKVVQTAGVGFTVTGLVVADTTSTWAWEVQ